MDPVGRLTMGTIEHIFQTRGWSYALDEGHLLTVFEDVPMVIGVDELREILLLEVPIMPGTGQAARRLVSPAAERGVGTYLGSLNYRLALGAFVRDHTDGEIDFQVVIPLRDSMLSVGQLEDAIYVAVAAVTNHAPVIVALLTGRITLEQALADLDSGRGAPPAQAV